MLPVVICGAGPVGLVLAVELAQRQVPVLLAERHLEPSSFPRGRAISTRSMEILRRLSVERELAAIGLPRSETAYFFSGDSLTAREFGRIGAGPAPRENGTSPTAALACPQDRLETLVAREDRRASADRGPVRHRSAGRDGLVLGGVYRSAAVHATGEAPAQSVARYEPDAAPGCRARMSGCPMAVLLSTCSGRGSPC
ncbi:MAG TPA: FAD-dependent monooxygenase [Pseudonocardiaceae bacterium]